MRAEDGEREAPVTCDGRLFHTWVAATGNGLSPTVDRWVHRTSRDVDDAECSRRLDSASAGRCSLSHVCWRQTILRFVCQYCDLIGDALRGLQSVKLAKQLADVVEPRWQEYQPSGCIQYQLKSLKKLCRNACQGRVTEIQPRKHSRDYHWLEDKCRHRLADTL